LTATNISDPYSNNRQQAFRSQPAGYPGPVSLPAVPGVQPLRQRQHLHSDLCRRTQHLLWAYQAIEAVTPYMDYWNGPNGTYLFHPTDPAVREVRSSYHRPNNSHQKIPKLNHFFHEREDHLCIRTRDGLSRTGFGVISPERPYLRCWPACDLVKTRDPLSCFSREWGIPGNLINCRKPPRKPGCPPRVKMVECAGTHLRWVKPPSAAFRPHFRYPAGYP